MYPTFYNNPMRVQACKEHIKRGGVPVVFCHAEPCSGFSTAIVYEMHKFDQALTGSNDISLYGYVDIIGNVTNWSMPGVSIIPGMTIVRDAFDTNIIYVENLDWIMPTQGTIRRIPTGSIADGTYVYVDYMWREECIDEKTRAPKPQCTVCSGTGTIYTWTMDAIGVFSMPSYKQPWMKEGFWREGDGVIGMDPDMDIDARPRDYKGHVVRDKFLIPRHGRMQTWVVMEMPQAPMMNGDMLAQNVHVRLYERAQDLGVAP